MPPTHSLPLLLLAALLATAGSAWAEGGQDLQFRASAGVALDSNLFRLPSNANTQALIGRSSAAETVGISTLGLNYNKPYSLQRVELDVSMVKYSYQNFGFLDFTALNYQGAWRWAYTPHLRGNLSTSREQTLNSYDDFRGFNVRNERVSTNTRFDGNYDLDANWRVLAGVTQSTRKNSLQTTTEADSRQLALDAGVRYVLPSGSSAGYTLRTADGNYTTNRTIPSAGFYDDSYTQTDNELQLTWAISRDTSAAFRAGHRSRSYPTYPQRNFDGLTGAANISWSYSAKAGLTAGWTREISTFESTDFNFSQIDRFSIGPVWQASPKATVRMQLAHAVRDFRGTPTGVVTLQRRDVTRDASVSVDWQPYTFLALSASLQNARRSSSLAGFDYSSNSVNVSAQFTY
jgi:exopolysaccharide biosynthesis operon protein EpsL